MVGLKSGHQSVFVVVRSLVEVFTSDIILALNLGRIELGVVSSARGFVDSSTLDSFDENLIISLKLNSFINLLSFGLEDFVKLLSLYGGSWESIEEDASLTLWFAESRHDEVKNELIRNQLASINNRLYSLAEVAS